MALAGVGRPLLLVQLVVTLVSVGGMLALASFSSASSRRVSIAGSWLGVVGLWLPMVIGSSDEGPHRWLAVGPVAFHLGFIVVPAYLVLLPRIPTTGRLHVGATVAGCSCALALQPAPQLAVALALGVAAAAWVGCWSVAEGVSISAIAVLGAAVAIGREIPLPPVPHVEGIVALARDLHPALAAGLVAGLVTTTALPIVLCRLGRAQPWRQGLPLTLGLAALAAAPLLGAYPVPLVGYGTSPVLGVSLALGLQLRYGSHHDSGSRCPPD